MLTKLKLRIPHLPRTHRLNRKDTFPPIFDFDEQARCDRTMEM